MSLPPATETIPVGPVRITSSRGVFTVEPAAWEHLTHLYGDEAGRVAALGPEPVHPGGPDLRGQVAYAADHEWATTVDDVVRRRTTLQIRGLDTPEVREGIAATLAERGVLMSPDGR